MNYKLAKQLKDAGLTQPYYYRANKAWYDEDGDFNDYGYDERDTYIPKLEELIDACGSHFSNLIYGYLSGTFRAYGFSDLTEGIDDEVCIDWCKTPTEAVARLWLELNK